MTSRITTHVERDEGEGKLLIEHKAVLKVRYTLEIERRTTRHPLLGTAPGKASGAGVLTVHDSDRYKKLGLTFPVQAQLALANEITILPILLDADGSFRLN